VVTTRCYRKGVLQDEGFPVADVSEHLDEADTVVWVDLCQPDGDELAELASELNLHELAVEDAVEEHQRPKLDRYASHMFLASKAVRLAGFATFDTTEVDAFIGPRWLVTVRKDEGFAVTDLTHRWDRSSALAANGVSFLVYGLLDVVVDGYFGIIERFDEALDNASDRVFSETPMSAEDQRHWFEVRQSLTRFHRIAAPMREAVSSLMRHDDTLITDEMYPYFQDVYDHILRVSEASDGQRDLVAAITDTNLALRDAHRNEIMKKATSWAAIVAVPTLVTGYYGMNVPYPGFGRTWGFWVSVVVMVVLGSSLYSLFRRKGWL
jgi:magnesium transporter